MWWEEAEKELEAQSAGEQTPVTPAPSRYVEEEVSFTNDIADDDGYVGPTDKSSFSNYDPNNFGATAGKNSWDEPIEAPPVRGKNSWDEPIEAPPVRGKNSWDEPILAPSPVVPEEEDPDDFYPPRETVKEPPGDFAIDNDDDDDELTYKTPDAPDDEADLVIPASYDPNGAREKGRPSFRDLSPPPKRREELKFEPLFEPEPTLFEPDPIVAQLAAGYDDDDEADLVIPAFTPEPLKREAPKAKPSRPYSREPISFSREEPSYGFKEDTASVVTGASLRQNALFGSKKTKAPASQPVVVTPSPQRSSSRLAKKPMTAKEEAEQAKLEASKNALFSTSTTKKTRPPPAATVSTRPPPAAAVSTPALPPRPPRGGGPTTPQPQSKPPATTPPPVQRRQEPPAPSWRGSTPYEVADKLGFKPAPDPVGADEAFKVARLFENERYNALSRNKFSAANLLPTDRRAYSTDRGNVSWKTPPEDEIRGKHWQWCQTSHLEAQWRPAEDWSYAKDFRQKMARKETKSRLDFVRRRAVTRKAELIIPGLNVITCKRVDPDAEKMMIGKLRDAVAVASLLKVPVPEDPVNFPLEIDVLNASVAPLIDAFIETLLLDFTNPKRGDTFMADLELCLKQQAQKAAGAGSVLAFGKKTLPPVPVFMDHVKNARLRALDFAIATGGMKDEDDEIGKTPVSAPIGSSSSPGTGSGAIVGGGQLPPGVSLPPGVTLGPATNKPPPGSVPLAQMEVKTPQLDMVLRPVARQAIRLYDNNTRRGCCNGDHAKDGGCMFASVTCPYCHRNCSRKAALQHENTCDRKPVQCEHCFIKVKRHQLEHHQTNNCPKRAVSCVFGCKEHVAAEELPAHYEKAVAAHLLVMLRRQQEADDKLVAAEDKILELQRTADDAIAQAKQAEAKLIATTSEINTAKLAVEAQLKAGDENIKANVIKIEKEIKNKVMDIHKNLTKAQSQIEVLEKKDETRAKRERAFVGA